MDEILALQAELARVQEAPTAFKLSEPNIVEIVSTLSQLRLVDVLFTTNGKEYLTPEQLLREVGDEILSHGGRVNVADLPALLNVDLPHIERAVTQLLAAGRDGLQRVGGERPPPLRQGRLGHAASVRALGRKSRRRRR